MCSEIVGYRIESDSHLLLANYCSFVYRVVVVIIEQGYFEPLICFCIIDFDGLRWDFDRIDRWLGSGLEISALCSFDFECRQKSWQELYCY